ncbi:hypothetical protein BHE74_00039076, partial [Ensete ventricosum]
RRHAQSPSPQAIVAVVGDLPAGAVPTTCRPYGLASPLHLGSLRVGAMPADAASINAPP